jgi:hypothetical protein
MVVSSIHLGFEDQAAKFKLEAQDEKRGNIEHCHKLYLSQRIRQLRKGAVLFDDK